MKTLIEHAAGWYQSTSGYPDRFRIASVAYWDDAEDYFFAPIVGVGNDIRLSVTGFTDAVTRYNQHRDGPPSILFSIVWFRETTLKELKGQVAMAVNRVYAILSASDPQRYAQIRAMLLASGQKLDSTHGMCHHDVYGDIPCFVTCDEHVTDKELAILAELPAKDGPYFLTKNGEIQPIVSSNHA